MRSRLRKRSLQASRPSIPIPCALALACVVGVFGGGALVGVLDHVYWGRALVVTSMLALVLMAVSVLKRAQLVLWLGAFLALGLALGLLHYALLDQTRANLPTTADTYSFILSEDAKDSTYGSQVSATIDEGPFAGKKVLLFTKERVCLFAGDHLQTETRLSAPGDDYRSYYDQRGLIASADVSAYECGENASLLSPVYQLRKRLLNIIGTGSDEQILLRAVLLGERSGLFDASFYHSIKVAGLAHLVAVSGAHLVIVTGFVTLLLKQLRVSSRISVALQALFLLIYLVLVGFPISCIRAAIMSALTLFALLAKRRSSSLTALGVTVLVLVALDPSVVYQLSFQLSVAATLGIVLFMPLLNEWFATLVPKMPEFIRESVSMTLAALIFSLPISVAQFATVPLISPLANIVATPYLSFLLMLGFASLLVSSVAPFMLTILGFVTKGLIGFFSFVEAIPFASIPFSISLEVALPLALGLALLIWFWWPTPRQHKKQMLVTLAITSLVVVALAVGVRIFPAGDRIIMLDVGQGDSFAFVSGGKTVLVDTGNKPEMLYDSLARNNITKIDAVLITHPDDDHCGNLHSLHGVVDVGQVIVAEGLDEVEDEKVKEFFMQVAQVVGPDRIVEVNRGDRLSFGIFTLDIVAPVQVENEGGNEDSICFYARIDLDHDGQMDWNAFFCGDAEEEALEELQDQHLLEQVDLYKVGHHGSRKALTPELASVLKPKVSLIGVGKNSYGHPTEETLSTLEAVGSQIYRSDQCGDVVCSFTPDSIELSTERSR